MKKSVLVLFAAVMVAVSGFMFTSCNKGDDDKPQTPDYGDPFGEGNQYSTRPKFVNGIFMGTEIDVKWTSATSIDTTTFEYEVLWSEIRNLNDLKNLKSSEMNSLGRQRDTIYHFSINSGLFEVVRGYHLRLVTHYWYNKEERQIETEGPGITFTNF